MRNHINFVLFLVWYFCFYVSLGFSHPTTASSLFASTSIKETTNKPNSDVLPSLPKIYAMQLETNVSHRFAKTLVTSKVRNSASTAQEFRFSIIIPDKAYVSKFVMEIDGKSYEAYVQEKELARNVYNQALQDGQTAAHVALNARDSNRFTVSVNLEAKTNAIFYLTYEDLLTRNNGRYEIVLNIHPGQPVEELDVKVNINESRPLKFVKAPNLRSGNEVTKNDQNLDPKAQIEIKKSFASVKFSPNIEHQRLLAKNLGVPEDKGLAGQFVVQYDVERDPFGGEVLVNDGYFVHFFAPSDLAPLPKNLVFVLDTSGSMQDVKIQQLKDALSSILNEINENDTLNIIEFGTSVKVWNIDEVKVQYSYGFDIWDPTAGSDVLNNSQKSLPLAVLANEIGVKNAKKVIDLLDPYGGTDILSALQIALKVVNFNKDKANERPSMIIFLTDGSPTVAELDTDKIIANITALNSNKTPIFSLSFGDNADKEFLDKLSIENFGFARLIYEGADASLQLQEFYRQISSPLLTNVTFKYAKNVSKITDTDFPLLFQGSELVVAGFGIDPDIDTQIDVSGLGVHGPIILEPEIKKPADNFERLWAYLTLKQILEQRKISENKTGPTQEALRLSKKYQFVTEVSSLVVLKPNNSSIVDLEDASKMFEDFEFQPTAISESGYPLLLIDSAPETDSFNSVAQINGLKSNLTWLSEILNDNGTISLNSGVYELGSSINLKEKSICLDSINNNKTAFCATLYNCPEIYPKLTSKDSFDKYFCKIKIKKKNIAGVCCIK